MDDDSPLTQQYVAYKFCIRTIIIRQRLEHPQQSIMSSSSYRSFSSNSFPSPSSFSSSSSSCGDDSDSVVVRVNRLHVTGSSGNYSMAGRMTYTQDGRSAELHFGSTMPGSWISSDSEEEDSEQQYSTGRKQGSGPRTGGSSGWWSSIRPLSSVSTALSGAYNAAHSQLLSLARNAGSNFSSCGSSRQTQTSPSDMLRKESARCSISSSNRQHEQVTEALALCEARMASLSSAATGRDESVARERAAGLAMLARAEQQGPTGYEEKLEELRRKLRRGVQLP